MSLRVCWLKRMCPFICVCVRACVSVGVSVCSSVGMSVCLCVEIKQMLIIGESKCSV